MPFVALYDAAALYPNAQRDLLIRIAQQGPPCLVAVFVCCTTHARPERRGSKRPDKPLPSGRPTRSTLPQRPDR